MFPALVASGGGGSSSISEWGALLGSWGSGGKVALQWQYRHRASLSSPAIMSIG